MDIVLIAAIGRNRELGLDNQLLWELPGDLPRFKQITMGSPIIMGRKTFDSIGRALPGRLNIVLTRDSGWQHQGVSAVADAKQALSVAQQERANQVFIIGGGEIYSLFLPMATRLELTLVDDAPRADAYFPDYSELGFKEIARQQNSANNLSFDYVSLVK